MANLASSREQLMAYRIQASGLDRTTKDVADLPIWDLGLQDRDGSAPIALAARLPKPEFERWLGLERLGGPGRRTDFAQVWSLRGSPHIHRRADLQAITDAIWPKDEKDAQARLVGSGKKLVANGSTGLDGYRSVAAAMRAVVTGTMRKSEASAALTSALPAEFAAFCGPCNAIHVMEMLFRCTALPGGLGLLPGQSATLQPLTPAVRQPANQSGLGDLIRAYLRLYGATGMPEVGGHLGTSAAALKADWPSTISITVDGTTLRTTAELAEAIPAADRRATAGLVRLLPPGDPLLQPRNRELLIPDKSAWKVLWPPIGPAGAVLAGAEIAGYWRPKKAGKQLGLTFTGFRRLTAPERTAIESEAELVAAARGVSDLSVTFAE